MSLVAVASTGRQLRRVESVLAGLVLGATLGPGSSEAQAQSSCADCHYANPDAPGHLSEWERSAHGRHAVGCEKCHGGDPTSFDAFRAHQGILDSRNPASPVNRTNLPRTCGQRTARRRSEVLLEDLANPPTPR